MKTKNILKYLAAAFMVSAAAVSCDKKNPEGGEPGVVTVSLRNVTLTSAECIGEATGSVAERGVCWSTEPDPTVNSTKIVCGSGAGTFSAGITGLAEGTTYYVRAYAINGGTPIYGEMQHFRTYEKSGPLFNMISVDDVSTDGASLTASLIMSMGMEITEMGICYGTSTAPTVADARIAAENTELGEFTVQAGGLTDATVYYARAYIEAGGDTFYSGIELKFTTNESLPVCDAPVIDNRQETSMDISVKVTGTGTREVVGWGYCWSLEPNPDIADNKVELGTSAGTSGSTVKRTQTGLPEVTMIYVRAYAITDLGTVVYSSEVQASTLNLYPTVATGTVTASTVRKYGAEIAGNRIVSVGDGGALTRAGVCFSWTKAQPTIEDETVEQTAGLTGGATFTLNAGIVPPASTVYVRAFAVNESGKEAYGEVVTFTTLNELMVYNPGDGQTPSSGMTAMRFYYGANATTHGTPSAWQKASYEALDAALIAYNTQRLYYPRIGFTSNTAATGVVAGTEKYITISIYYSPTGSSTSSTYASFDMKFAQDDRGLFSFSDMRRQTSGSAYTRFNTMYENAGIKAWVDDFVAYLESGKFMIEIDVPTSDSYFNFIPIDNRDRYHRFNRVRGAINYIPAW